MSKFNPTPAPVHAPKSKFFYGYIVVAASVIIQGIAWGMYNGYGVFFPSLLKEFGWSRATISASASIAQIMIGIGSIILGRLNDRFGPRMLVALSGIVVGLGYFLMSQVHAVWQLYLAYGIIIGFGLSGADVLLLALTAKWFIKKRGTMTGVVKTGTGLGIMIVPPVSVALIVAYGWRQAFVIIAIAFVVIMVGIAQFLRRDPAEMGQLPDGEQAAVNAPKAKALSGLSLRQALRDRQFWLVCLAYLTVFFVGNSVIIHIPPHVVDLKFSQTFAATLVAASGGASIAGRLLMGFWADKIGTRRVFALCFILLIIAMVWLLLANNSWQLWVFSILYGLANGGAFSIFSPVVAEYFGTKSHSLFLGVFIFVGSLGGAAGPLITGHIYDVTTSYRMAFLLLLALSCIGFVLLLIAGKVRSHQTNT